MKIYISGVFDLLHFGHVELFQKVRKLYPEDFIIAGVHNDRDVATYKRTPIMTENERIRSVKSLNIVDLVIGDAPITESEDFYKQFGIDIIVHAHSQEQDAAYRKLHSPHAGDRLVRLDYTSDISTTDLLSRLKIS